ncbi:LysR family transcriptional regulator [Myxococcota bacterium]|nr:LysR family transcriptional regulator [Myxococcota bacterium]
MALDLDALRAFVHVVELGSFTRAAEQLGLSKSRISLRVRSLEDELGCRLLQRTTRTVRPTADGELLLPRARRLVAEADDLASMFQASTALRGRVRIDLPVVLARTDVIPRLPELLAAHPKLELLVGTTDRRVEVVKEGFDCVLRIGALTDSGLVAKRLGVLAMGNYASPAYLHRHGTPRTIDELDGHYLVHYSMTLGGDPPTFEYRDGDGYRERPMRSLVTVNSADAFQAACFAGLGIIQAPRRGLRDAVERGRLVELLPEHTCAPMPVSLVHGHGRAVPKRVRAVMAWLAQVVEPLLDPSDGDRAP